jgi:hypothetical protein
VAVGRRWAVRVAVRASRARQQQELVDYPPSTTVASAPPSVVAAAPAVPLKAVYDDAPAAVPAGPKTSFGDGTWVVGEDIVPGNYKSAGAQSGLFEYCQITTHFDENAESSFLDWKNANADEPIRVKVSGDWVVGRAGLPIFGPDHTTGRRGLDRVQ